jgi:hypothetical protein
VRISGIYSVFLSTFIILLIISTANCINNDTFLDNFNNGIDPQLWKIEGSWFPNSEECYDRPQSIVSGLICRENANISLEKIFSGPCRISFLWKISEGHNKLILYDNNRSTPYDLPGYRFGSEGHKSVNWTEVTFNLSDRNEHRLKWIHENPYDEGKAWLDKVQIIYCTSPKFESFSVSPGEAICLSDSVNDVDSDLVISSKFNYSVESSSDNLTLYIAPPNSNDALGPFYPSAKNRSSHDLNKFVWNNIKLKCRDIGNASFWFVTEDGYLSRKEDGPYISTFIYDTTSEIFDVREKSHKNRYGISLKSTKNWNVNIKMPDGSQLDVTKKYSANTESQDIKWEYLWDDTRSIPSSLSFYLS